MIGTFVFVASFLLLVTITLLFPNVPPGQIICDALGNSETSYSLAKISGEHVVASIINGLIWGVIIVMVYSYLRGPSKGKISLPVWLPGYTTSHNSKNENKSTKKFANSSFQERRKLQDLESIQGIGYIDIFKLKQIDINTVDDLLYVASSKSGRNNLAQIIGVAPSKIRSWVNHAEAHKAHKKT
jgi:hypothetical protein